MKSILATRNGGPLGMMTIRPYVTDMAGAGVIAPGSGPSVETITDGMAPHPAPSAAIKDAILLALGGDRRPEPKAS